MAQGFHRFTDQARQVKHLAEEEAHRFGHHALGTEHLLLGLIRQRQGIAARVLNRLGVDVDRVRSAVEFIIGRGQAPAPGQLGLTPRAQRVIELAVDEARRLRHDYIGTEHLLLGLVREGEGVAVGILAAMGVSLDVRQARELVQDVLSQSDAQAEEHRPLPRRRRPASPSGRTEARGEDPSRRDRFERFTAGARRVLTLAEEEAHRHRHAYIGTGHLLLGLIGEREGIAAQALAELGVDPERVRRQLVARAKPEDRQGLTPGAQKVIERAVKESVRRQHGYLGTEHLLLALLAADAGTGVSILESLGVSREAARCRRAASPKLKGPRCLDWKTSRSRRA